MKNLLGRHILSGVEMGVVPKSEDDYWDRDAESISFVLDGKTYMAIEDPSDGYRSYSGDIVEVSDKVKLKNTFAPHEVDITHKDRYEEEDDGWNRRCDIYIFTDILTGKVIMEIGTDNTNDYYPSCVMYFNPENLYINHQ